MPTLHFRFALLVAAVFVVSCGSSDTASPGAPGSMVKDAGDTQRATVGTALQPYSVKLTDLDGQPVTGAEVAWSVVTGGGSVEPSSVTNNAGVAQVVATLGTAAGEQTVRAKAEGYSGSPVTFASTGTAGPATKLAKVSGDAQRGPKATTLALPLTVRIGDQFNNPVSGITVTWAVVSGGGSVASPTSISGDDGLAEITWTLGPTAIPSRVTAKVLGLARAFTATATSPFTVLNSGFNVPERFGSDLWVADGYAYTGTWGRRVSYGNAVKIWRLDAGGAPVLQDSITVTSGVDPSVATVSDVQVSDDGSWVVFTTEGGPDNGLYVYQLTTPGHAVFRARTLVANGLHTGALAVIGGTLYAFAAKDPSNCALEIYDLSQAGTGTITEASATPIPDNYCIHDTFVRDGYAFVFAWNSGLYIFDVGNGSHGGSPTNPALISHTFGYGGETHNGWWFWNPTNGEKKYLFIGEEGPGQLGSSSSGDIHVVDVSNLAAPVEVGHYHMDGAGTHNFWMDEPAQRLYAAYYNGGVVALDVSGVLSGDLANREISRVQPGGAGNTFIWGVMLYQGSLYATDMISGFWQLGVP